MLHPRAVMDLIDTELEEVKILVPRRLGDERGFSSEAWNARDFASHGIDAAFVQDNRVLNPRRDTLRGLHYQTPPAAQGKLIRITRGAVLDVAVDIRRGSPTFGRFAKVVLSVHNWYQIRIPPGFAHRYCTLDADTEVQYKVTEFYSPTHERGIAWDDPQLAIPWPGGPEAAIVSQRDRVHPRLADQPDLFECHG